MLNVLPIVPNRIKIGFRNGLDIAGSKDRGTGLRIVARNEKMYVALKKNETTECLFYAVKMCNSDTFAFENVFTHASCKNNVSDAK